MNRKSQAVTMDGILAVLLFIGAFFAVFFLVSNKDTSTVQDLKKEAERISAEVNVNSNLSIVNGNTLNQSQVSRLINTSYDDRKRGLNTLHEFCIYFEDENGNLIKINGTNGIGSPLINISGVPCR